MKSTEHRFISFDETPIFYRQLRIKGGAKAVLLIVHGMGEHGGRYQNFMEYLGSQGIESVVPDLRGFGKSGGRRGCVGDFSDYHRDLKALHQHLLKQGNRTPVFLMGHSFGGLVASSYVVWPGRPHLDGLVLSSPAFGIAIRVPLWRHVMGVIFSYLVPNLTQDNRVDPTMLTHDPEQIEKLKLDSLGHHRISARFYREAKRLMNQACQISQQITLPVLVLQAGDDRVVLKHETVRFFEMLASGDKQIEIYPGFYHEILNEKGRERVYCRIVNWIVAHITHK